jgi:hypothetical protein
MRVQGINIRFAAMELLSLICMSVCFAGPAALEGPSSRVQLGTPTFKNTTILPAARQKRDAPSARLQLDLRAPEITKATGTSPQAAGRNAFGASSGIASALQLSVAKPKSPAEVFVKRVQREGLPIARLWENDSALVSVGLNQKGQMGLWLIQKTN